MIPQGLASWLGSHGVTSSLWDNVGSIGDRKGIYGSRLYRGAGCSCAAFRTRYGRKMFILSVPLLSPHFPKGTGSGEGTGLRDEALGCHQRVLDKNEP